MPTSQGRLDKYQLYDFLIVGGGPAALSAAFYARTKQLKTLMLYEELGGKLGWRHRFAGPLEAQIAWHSGARPLEDALSREVVDMEEEALPGNEVVRLLMSRTVMQAVPVLHDRALKITVQDDYFHVETELYSGLRSAAVLIATGTSPLPLTVPGAQRLVRQGLGYSITTYARLVTGKRVAVIGTTRRALCGVAELARTAQRVYLITPDADIWKTPFSQALQHPAVEVLDGYEVKEVVGVARIQGVIIERAGVTKRIDVDRAFVDLGLVPQSDLVNDLAGIDPAGFIVVDACHQTTVPGLFAAGDVTTARCEQVLVAVGDGARAAMHAYEYLLARGLGPIGVSG